MPTNRESAPFRWNACEVIADVFIDVIHHLLKQAVLIRFQCQNEITFALNNLFGNGDLSSHVGRSEVGILREIGVSGYCEICFAA